LNSGRAKLPRRHSTLSRKRNNVGFARYSQTRRRKVTGQTHDSDYFRRRAAEARAAATSKGRDEQAEVAGELALAYAGLARHRAAQAEAEALACTASVVETA
jgi:hypothetical protein